MLGHSMRLVLVSCSVVLHMSSLCCSALRAHAATRRAGEAIAALSDAAITGDSLASLAAVEAFSSLLLHYPEARSVLHSHSVDEVVDTAGRMWGPKSPVFYAAYLRCIGRMDEGRGVGQDGGVGAKAMFT